MKPTTPTLEELQSLVGKMVTCLDKRTGVKYKAPVRSVKIAGYGHLAYVQLADSEKWVAIKREDVC